MWLWIAGGAFMKTVGENLALKTGVHWGGVIDLEKCGC